MQMPAGQDVFSMRSDGAQALLAGSMAAGSAPNMEQARRRLSGALNTLQVSGCIHACYVQ